jgi:hypothetical protein
MDSKPFILLPISLRGGSKFRALGRHEFSSEEKLWVCEHLMNTCNDLEAELAPAISLWCTRYSVKENVLNTWMNLYAQHGTFLSVCPVDIIGIRVIRAAVRRGRQRGETEAEYAERLQYVLAEQLEETADRCS